MKTKLTVKERIGIRNLLNEKYTKGGLTLDSLLTAQRIIEKTEVELKFLDKPDKPDKPEKGDSASNVEVYTAIGGQEAVKVELKRIAGIQNGQLVAQFVWNEKKDKGVDIELSSDEIKLLKDVIESKNATKEFRIDETWIAELNRKLQ